jgi:uncharacterized protein (TIGR02466 family)
MVARSDIKLLTHLLPHLVCEADLSIGQRDHEAMSRAVWALHATDSVGRKISNGGAGWQAEIDDRKLFGPVLSAVEQAVAILLENYAIGFRELVFTTLWANINFHRDFNITHRHGGELSGVYFIDVAEGCGDLVIGSTAAYYIANPLVKRARNADGESFLGHSITPKSGRAVIFSSETNHHVDCNLTDRPRVSIAWNMQVKDDAKESNLRP